MAVGTGGYRYAGKRRTLALGVYPIVTLSDARSRRQEARKLLVQNIDPATAKRAAKRAGKLASENTFEAVTRGWLANQRHRLAPKYWALLLARLEADIFPQIGSRPIAEIDAPELLEALRKVEKRGVIETARRLRQICGRLPAMSQQYLPNHRNTCASPENLQVPREIGTGTRQ